MTPQVDSTSLACLKDSQGQTSHIDYANHLFEKGLFYDCIVSCQHHRWHLHRAILAQRCEFFRACFLHSFQESVPSRIGGYSEVKMDEDDPRSLARMLKWLYTLEYPLLDGATPTSQLPPSEKPDLPNNFWTSELSLFIVADKYDLARLAEQASASICDAVTQLPPISGSTSTDEVPFSSFDDFVDMLEMIYINLPSVSTNAEQLKYNLLHGSALRIAAYTSRQPKLSTLVTTIPEFTTDLVESLRCIAEASTSVTSDRGEYGYESKPGVSRPVGTGAGWVSYRSGSESDNGSQSSGGRRGRIYVPLNEDSDTD